MRETLGHGAFDPEMTSLLAVAFERAWQTLQTAQQITDAARANAMRDDLAKAVVAAARRPGMRDVDGLADDALAIFYSNATRP